MFSQLSLINLGRSSEVRRVSRSRNPHGPTESKIGETLHGNISSHRRSQILFDPSVVYQFLCVYDGTVGYFTHPVIMDQEGGDPIVAGSFSDTLGHPVPMTIPLDIFLSRFTTLVRKGDAASFNLPSHPTDPDMIRGAGLALRGREIAPVDASLDRLNFPMVEDPAPEDFPIIAALPQVLPVGPDCTVEHAKRLEDFPDVIDRTYPLVSTWLTGVKYVLAANGGASVTEGGNLFYTPDLEVEGVDAQPFAALDVSTNLFVGPNLVGPTDRLYSAIVDQQFAFFDRVWADVGSRQEPAVPPQAQGGAQGLLGQELKSVLEPLSREKTYKNSPRSQAKYRLLLAQEPADGDSHVVLPQLSSTFLTYLAEPTSATAADDLREIVRNRVTILSKSMLSRDKDATWEADNVTVAFSERLKGARWLTEPLPGATKVGARDKLGLVHFLTPDRTGLATVAESDSHAKTITLANTGNSTAQLEASKSSKLYTGGRLTHPRHCYECVLNFRCLMGVMVEDPSKSMVVDKLLEYAEVIVSKKGRMFFDIQGKGTHLAIHLWQDLQLILTTFLEVSANCELYQSVMGGSEVSYSNYATALAVADSCISDLRTIVNGNGLGKFGGVPCCVSWFVATPRADPRTDNRADRSAVKKPRILDDPAEAERRTRYGMLDFDPDEAGTKRLPTCKVRAKRRGSKYPERLCMPFLTRGHQCGNPNCKLPHLPNLDGLSDADRKEFHEFVDKTPGLSWVPGKAPPGTP